MRRPVSSAAALLACAAPLALAACTVGPDYRRPTPLPAAQDAPFAFKEAGWTPAAQTAVVDKGAWWIVFGDPVLNELEGRVALTNQNVAAAEANFRQAVAIVKQSRSELFPSVDLSSSITRSGGGNGSSGVIIGGVVTGGNTGTTTGSTGTGTTGSTSGGTLVTSNGSSERTNYQLGASASWTLDVWGRIRRGVEADRATAQASAADLAAATLSAQSTLATTYFNMRLFDEQARIFGENLQGYERALKVTTNQYNAGVVARGDVIQAQTQVFNTQAQLQDLGRQRAANEHAIAILTGRPPSALTLAADRLPRIAPVAPPGLPSTLLERRPDIAGAERAVAAANAQIGVATAAYYPDITLSGSATSSSTSFGDIFDPANFVWSLGPRLAYTLLDFGNRRARVQQTRAVYDRTVADYRQTVLTAFGEVEDQLAALRVLEQQQGVREQAEASARRAEEIQLNQYRAGLQPFTSVITAQQQSLAAQQNSVGVLGLRLQASVLLIQALGGGWTDADLPLAKSLR